MESIFAELKMALAAGTIGSSLLALGLAYIGGIVSSFTPCIYPMIPITVGFIGGTARSSLKAGWILSSFYVLGMAAVYATLGVVASLSGKIFGAFTNTSGWYLALGTIMLVSSLWMLNVIKFDPNVWLSKLTTGRKKLGPSFLEKNEGTILGAFILGASSGLIASPCTTPILTTILSYIATQKSVLFGGILMFAFACGLGTILVVIGTFAGIMKILPRSGKWLESVKLASGFLIMALAQYFVFKAGTLK